MAKIEVKVNERAVVFLTRFLPTGAFAEIAKVVQTITLQMEKYIKETTYPESGLHVRTGNLRRSIRAQKVIHEGRSVIGRVLAGQRLAYARIQEYGGAIVPVRAQALTIPLDAAKTPAGVARFDARGAQDAGYRTFIRNQIIYGVKRSSGKSSVTKHGQIRFRVKYSKPIPLFKLVKRVEIPERRYMRNAMDHFRPIIISSIANAVKAEIRQIPK